MTVSWDSAMLLTLLNLRGVGNRTALKILRMQPGPPDDVKQLNTALARAQEMGVRLALPSLADLEFAWDRSQDILSACHEQAICPVGIGNDLYPSRLQVIDDAPVVLYLRGSAEALTIRPSVAIIGTREPTNYGRECARKIATLVSTRSGLVVSGLALGCDTEAHRGALSGNGKTIAVLAHGLDSVSPRQNRGLAEEIIDSGGCLVSEYPPGTDARPNFFVARDRIQSGLSDAVVVVETDVTGGTMHTVNFCQQQGRKLGCLAHRESLLGHPKTRGNQKLVKEGLAVPLADRAAFEAFLDSLSHATTEDAVTPASPSNSPLRQSSSAVIQPEFDF